MASISTKNGDVAQAAAVVLPKEKEKTKALPFRYQFAAGAVAGISEVRSHGRSFEGIETIIHCNRAN